VFVVRPLAVGRFEREAVVTVTPPSGHEPYLRALPVPAFVVDRDGRVAAWNDVAAERFGWQASEVVGEHPPCVPAGERARWREALEAAVAEAAVDGREFSLHTVDGRRIEATVSMAAVDDGGAFVAVEDRTEESALDRELRLYDRVLRHDLRNDLNLVTGYAEELAERVDDPTAEELVAEITATAQSVVALAETARDLDDAVGASDPLEAVDVDAVVAAALEDADDEGVAVSATLASVRARAAPQLPLAVEHVLDNAIAHNDAPEPTVDVTVREVVEDGRRWATLVVEDNGPGIPEAEREVLTEGSETPLRHGSGLGLWLVYWVVRQSNGELSYEPVEPRGSRVTIRLLAADE